jgi:RimJ/RimL family protein N-acetyltransferase
VKLRPYEDSDRGLTVALERDAEVMAHLGGPTSEERLAVVHRRRAEITEPDELYFVIEEDGESAGQIGVWRSAHGGEAIHEVGWIVLPRFQGRGIATAALEELLARVRGVPSVERVHAFPATANAPSNALCRRFGFELIEPLEITHRGQALSCNHWALDVS